MRKTTILFIAMLVASFSVFAVDMTGTYKVGTTLGADFTSLSAAINALNTATVTGDVVFEITSDITEAANFGLGKDMGSFKLTIRPDADANRTITFTQATANAGPWGHFVIGCATTNLGSALADGTVVSTNNVTIDGYALNGNTRRLKLTTSNASLLGSSLVSITGGSSNTKIQNCTLENLSSSTTGTGNNPRCIYITQFKGATSDVSPSNILIINNIISTGIQTSASNGIAIQCSRSGSAATYITGLQVKNNTISASNTCVEIQYANGVEISGNEIKVQKGTGTGGAYGVWLRGSSGTMNVIGNKFTETSTNQSAASSYLLQTISIASGSTNIFNSNIFNNTFSGIDRKAIGSTKIDQTYIGDAGYGTTKVYNNSFYLPTLTQSSQAGYYHAFKFTGSLKAADIQNNIFISNDDSKSILISDPITSGSMDNNVYFLHAGSTKAKVVSTYATLDAFQLANPTLDIHSKSVDVNFTNAATGDLTLAGTSINNVDLATLRLSSVLTDFNTSPRAEITYKGAYEASDFTPIAKQYTVNVPNGTSKVFVAGSFPGKDWDITTPYQLTPTSTANQFWGILPYYNGLSYKYLCEKGDWDYQEAAYNGSNPPVTGSNRSYNAIDNVPIWFRVKSIAMNVSFATSAVPTQLFVKGSWDAWAAPIELTKSGNTFSKIISGILSDKIPANTIYKFYTNDEASGNWESDAFGSAINDRWTIAPVMNDVIARFTTAITTGLDKALMQAGVQISKNGIFIPANGTSSIELYTLNGTLIEKTITNNSYSRALNNGAYIVKINGKAVKFVK